MHVVWKAVRSASNDHGPFGNARTFDFYKPVVPDAELDRNFVGNIVLHHCD